ncbi:hypothetical protein TeGR_g1660 [Tetraparma gracilis]|uniref:Anaphase-promoting complex subunit 1 n=1 Tax=Tetraparma gracilis TaxID=2962635 RepID=A0ABQ6NDF1_9STRA|nr:hypothetical protein TeGR_g1660 [Tetraparma gracilis]
MASFTPVPPLPHCSPSLVSLSPCGGFVALLPSPSRLCVYRVAPFELVRRFSAVDYIDRLEWAPEGYDEPRAQVLPQDDEAQDDEATAASISTSTAAKAEPTEATAMGLILLTLLKRSQVTVISLRDSAFHCSLSPPLLTHATFAATSRHVLCSSDFAGPLAGYPLSAAPGAAPAFSVADSKSPLTVCQSPPSYLGPPTLCVVTRSAGKDVARIYTCSGSRYALLCSLPLPTADCARALLVPSPVSPSHLQLLAVDHHL